MSRSLRAVAAALLAFASLAAIAGSSATPAEAFADSSNIVVVRVGSGGSALSSAATALFLDEYTQAGTLVSSTALPTSTSGANRRLTVSGTATSEGALALSADGRYLTLAGYDADPGTASIATTTSAAVPRVVARVDAGSTLDTSTAITDTFSASNVRGAVTDDGSRFWAVGANGGVRLATLGSAGASTQINSAAPTNIRTVSIANGQLYISTGSAPTGLYTVGSGLPTTGGQTPALVTAAPSPYAFVALDRDAVVPGVDTLYIADDSGSPGGGILKFSFDGIAWTARGSFRPAASGARGLTGSVTGSGVTLFATTSAATNALVKVDDAAAFNATINATGTTLQTAAANTAFRGIAFTPAGGVSAPSITTQPRSTTIDTGETATLTVGAAGTAPLSYQWYQGTAGDTSTPVGTDAASFTTPALTDTTSYWVRVTNALGSADSDTATVTVEAGTPPCQGPVSSIGFVEGSGDVSPVAGSTVTVRGVVVGDYEGTGSLRGFYLQDAGDSDPATSDGIFVFDNVLNGVSNGDLVEVTGVVSEFQGQTQLTAGAPDIAVCGSGDVTATDVTLPMATADAFEKYEGMLVRFHQTLSVSEHFQLGRFGEVVVSSDGRLRQPTAIVAPGAPAAAMQAANDLKQIKIDDELNTQNPDPIRFGRNGNPLSASNTLRGGDTITDAVGVMTYTWAGNSASPNAYRLRPINALHGAATFVESNTRPTGPPDVGGDIKVGGANLLNFFDDFTGCTFGVGGGPADCRGAENNTEYQRQLAKEVAALTKLDVDVLAVMEIENDGYAPDSAIQKLVDAMNAATAPDRWAFVDPDGALGITNAAGTDAIKAAILYRTDRVTPTDKTFADTASSLWERRPVAQEFQTPTGRFTIVANHFKSKGSCPASGPDTDQGDGQSCWNAHRTAQANELLSFVNGTVIPATGDPDVVLLGDFNSYAKEDPVAALETGGYTNLVGNLHGDDAYSYVFDGQWGYLDYAFASPSLLAQVTGADDYHINADEPSVLDYNTNFKTAGLIASLYAPDEFRTSDHDSVRLGLTFTDSSAPVVTPSVTGPSGDAGWYVGDVTVSWTVTDPDSAVTTSGCDTTVVNADTTGTTITCTATSAGGTTSESVTIKRDATNPEVVWHGGITDGAHFVFGTVPAAPTCDAVDPTSGPNGCTVTGYATGVGPHTLTATANDVAGNTGVDTRSYTVDGYTLRGFYGSVHSGDGLNVVKDGSTVPLQFEVFAGATELTSKSVVSSLTTTPINCSTHATIGGASTVGAALRYDDKSGWFVYNWKTVKKQKGCVRATVTTVDGSTLSALFQLK